MEMFLRPRVYCKIAEAAGAHPDFFIFQAVPGAGAGLAPRLLAALAEMPRKALPPRLPRIFHGGKGVKVLRNGRKRFVLAFLKRLTLRIIRHRIYEHWGT
jgi:hypothetical protein